MHMFVAAPGMLIAYLGSAAPLLWKSISTILRYMCWNQRFATHCRMSFADNYELGERNGVDFHSSTMQIVTWSAVPRNISTLQSQLLFEMPTLLQANPLAVMPRDMKRLCISVMRTLIHFQINIQCSFAPQANESPAPLMHALPLARLLQSRYQFFSCKVQAHDFSLAGLQKTSGKNSRGGSAGSLFTGEHHEIRGTWEHSHNVRCLLRDGQSLRSDGALPRRWLVSVALWPPPVAGETRRHCLRTNVALQSFNFPFPGTTSWDRCPHHRVRLPHKFILTISFSNSRLKVSKCCLLWSIATVASSCTTTSSWRMCSASGLLKMPPCLCMCVLCKLADAPST